MADASVFCEVNHESEFYTALSKYTLRNWIYLFRSQFFDKHNASCWIIFKCCEIMSKFKQG